MKIQPREYQTACVHSIYSYFQSNSGNPICALPTGTGKSVVIASFLESIYAQYPNQKVLVVTHVKELIKQNFDKLIALWPNAPAGINSAGLKRRDKHHSILFCGIASIARKWKEFGRVDLIIIDEAHLVSPNDETLYQMLINGLKSVNPALKVIGLTATPWRLGQGKITDDGIFTDICFDMTNINAFNWLIEEGYLSKLIPKRTKTEIDTDDLHIRAGEFINSELEVIVDKETITNAALLEAFEVGHDRQHWLIFAISIEHAIHIRDAMEAMGETCGIVHSKMSSGERDKTLEDFKSGKLRACVNVGVLTTGFDFPEIDLIIMLRPTASTVLWIQMLGRGTRPVYAKGFDLGTKDGRLAAIAQGPKQSCMVLDFAGNTQRLGPINDPVIPRKKGQKGGEAPVKCCDVCGTYNHTLAKRCISCDVEFKFQVKIKHTAATGELIKEDLPVTEIFKIDHITYAKHTKLDRPPTMKVSYYCGLRLFEEYVCFEHDGFAKRKAKDWWSERSHDQFPESVDDAISQSEILTAPTHMRVWLNKKYPEILAFDYTGTAFGRDQIAKSA